MLPSLTKQVDVLTEAISHWKKDFLFPDRTDLRVFSSSEEAISEVIHGLSNLFPHKKKVLVIREGHELLGKASTFLSSEAYELTMVDWQEALEKKEELVKEDYCFCLAAEDNFLTGQIYPYQDFLAFWNKARKFSISISSRSHFYDKEFASQKEGFRARILSLGTHSAFAVLGSRMRKLASLILDGRAMPEDTLEQVGQWHHFMAKTDFQTELENSLDKDFVPYFNQQSRTPDRYVFKIPGVDAFALKQLALEKWGSDWDQHMITGSLCEWGGIRELRWLQEQDQIEISEIFVISVEAFEKKKAELSPLLKEIRSLMS